MRHTRTPTSSARSRPSRPPGASSAYSAEGAAMKALVKAKAEPGIWMMDVPEPKIGPNDVLIRMKKTAICGTDMHIWHWDDWAQRTIKVPMAVGHEYCGEIVAIGSEVRGLGVGDRVSREGPIN